MAAPRVVLLSVLDGRGRFGLGPESAAASRLGVDVIPISTGVVESGDTPSVRPVRPRLVATALRAALEDPVDGMMIGLLPDYWQARAVHRILAQHLPETMVWSPLSPVTDLLPALGSYNRRLQVTHLVPEATVAILPEGSAGEMLGQTGADRTTAGSLLVGHGAHAAWVRGERENGRCVDTLQIGNDPAVLDYPAEDASDVPVAGAVLAALLACGHDLRGAVEAANRHDARIGDDVNVGVRA